MSISQYDKGIYPIKTKHSLLIVLTILALTFSALGVTPAYAATITVQSDTDDGTATAGNCPGANCRLRDAIAAAESGDTITFGTLFDTAKTILLTSQLTISKNLTIDGTGHSVTVSGNHVTRVFNVTAGTVAFSHLTIADGMVGTVPAADCGGYDLKCGGGMILQNNSAISVTVMDSAFSGNSAANLGGGIYNRSGTLTVTNSTFSGNGATSGGGIYNDSTYTLTVTNSTFSGNSATDSGGGIFNDSSSTLTVTTVTNSTFSGNSAANSSYSSGSGGGIRIKTGTLIVTNSTFSGNSGFNPGSGISKDYIGPTPRMLLKNTLIVKGTSDGSNCNFFPTVTASTNNRANDGTCGSSFTNSASILLGSLGDHGGSTQTIPLLPGSSAIDAGDPTTCAAAPVSGKDQRGMTRPSACDIGAFESQGFTLGSPTGGGQSAAINTNFTNPLALTVTANDTGVPVTGLIVTFTPPASGASAALSGSPITVGVDGKASVTANANGTVGGPYNVTASAPGATSLDFALTNNQISNLTVLVLRDTTQPQDGAVLTQGISSMTIQFSQDVLHDSATSEHSALNPLNYLLVNPGSNGSFETSACGPAGVGGLKPDDQQITVDSITYDPTSFLATLYINQGVALPGGTYRLFICGTTSITDPTQTVFLNNHTSDSILNFVISQGAATTNAKNNNSKLPNTGFAPGLVTNLPLQPAAKVYSTYGSLLLEIPALGVNTSIIGVPATSDGWDVTWLGSQAGWLNGTAFPTWNGNSVITGHVWDANNQPGIFVNLRQLKYGDQVKIHAWGQVYTFEVRSNASILPGNLASVLTHEDKSWITLLTCENYNPFSTQYARRRIARAVLVNVTAEK